MRSYLVPLLVILALVPLACAEGEDLVEEEIAEPTQEVSFGEAGEEEPLRITVSEPRIEERAPLTEEGGKTIVVDVTVENISDGQAAYTEAPFELWTTDGEVHDPAPLPEGEEALGPDRLRGGTLEPGDSAEGLIAYQVAEDTEVEVLYYTEVGEGPIAWR